MTGVDLYEKWLESNGEVMSPGDGGYTRAEVEHFWSELDDQERAAWTVFATKVSLRG